MELVLAFFYLISIVLLTRHYPWSALAISVNAYLFNSIITESGSLAYNIIGAGAPILLFLGVLINTLLVKKPLKIFNNKLIYYTLFLFLVMLFSTLWSEDPYKAIEVSFRFLALCIIYIWVIFIIATDTSKIKKGILSYMKMTFLIALFAGTYAFLENRSTSIYILRLTLGNSTSAIPLAILLSQGILYSIYKILYSKNKFLLIGFILSGIFLTYVMLLTNTRSTLIATLISIVFFILISRKKLTIKKKIILLFFSSLVIPVLWTIFTSENETFQRLTVGFNRIFSGEYGESESSRLDAWLFAIKIFSEHPFGGVGTGNFGQYYIAYPHNLFLELLSENGIIGFILIVMIIGLGFFSAVKVKSVEAKLAAAFFVQTFIVSQVSLTMWMHKWLFIWIAILIVFHKFEKFSKRLKNETK